MRSAWAGWRGFPLISAALFIGAGVILILGAVLFGAAKTGPQNTAGGAVAFLGLLVASLGALVMVAGF